MSLFSSAEEKPA